MSIRLSTNQMSSAGLRELLARQADLQFTQMQIATNRRILSPADDPVATAAISSLNAEISQLEQYNRNGKTAESGNELEESILSSSTDVLFRVRTLMVQSVNGILSKNELSGIKVEMNERLNELLGLANSRNSSGDYIFSGSKVKAQAFTKDATGTINYNGDQSQRLLRVSSGVTTALNDSGFDVFEDVKNGNGKFLTAANAANTGGGVISPGSYQSPPTFLAEPYDITFGTNLAGDTTYTVTGVTSGTTVVAATVFDANSAINFNGVTTQVSGTPVSGDVFHITQSNSQNVFTTIQNAVNVLENFSESEAGRAQMLSTMNAMQASLDQNMLKIDVVRGKVGSRLNAIDSESSSNMSLLITSKSGLSAIQDLDIVEASTRLSQQVTVLEAAQASFVRVQNLSLFNFIR